MEKDSNVQSDRQKKRGGLEQAVELNRKSILESDRQFKGTRFTVERRKIINVNGAGHEVDVFVQTHRFLMCILNPVGPLSQKG